MEIIFSKKFQNQAKKIIENKKNLQSKTEDIIKIKKLNNQQHDSNKNIRKK